MRCGRPKHIWLSTAADLRIDARRDLDDIKASHVELHALNRQPYCRLDSPEVSPSHLLRVPCSRLWLCAFPHLRDLVIMTGPTAMGSPLVWASTSNLKPPIQISLQDTDDSLSKHRNWMLHGLTAVPPWQSLMPSIMGQADIKVCNGRWM